MMSVLIDRFYLPVQRFGMDLRESLLSAVGPLEGERLLRFDLIAAALTNVYFTWYRGYYGDMSVEELNEHFARYIRHCAEY